VKDALDQILTTAPHKARYYTPLLHVLEQGYAFEKVLTDHQMTDAEAEHLAHYAVTAKIQTLIKVWFIALRHCQV